jgi:hypothetical protein
MKTNINKPTPARISQLIAILMVIQTAINTQSDPIEYTQWYSLGLAVLVGVLALFTGTNKTAK